MMREDVEYKEARADDSAYLKSEIRAIDAGQVSDEVERLQDLVDTIHKDITVLNDRISPVLKEDYPSPAAPGGEDIPQLVPLASALRNINDQMVRAHLRLSNIEERISL